MRNSRSLVSDHRRHDRLLVARYAVGDAQFGQDHEAQDLIQRCSECAALADDIGRLSRAVGQLPAARRPRDFRLTAEQADKLRGSRLERWLRALTGSGWAAVRPVAAVALSLGLVMSVVGVLPILGAATPGAPATTTDMSVGAAPSPDVHRSDTNGMEGPTVAPGRELGDSDGPMNAQGSADSELNNAYVDASPGARPVPDEAGAPEAATPSALGVREVLIYAGLSLTAIALVILVLLYAARQRFSDPLLR